MKTSRQFAEELVVRFRRRRAPRSVVPATAPAFAGLDRRGYDRFRADLERGGYRLLGDYLIVEVDADPGSLVVPTVIRCMVSADGGTCANYYQLSPAPWRLIRHCATIARARGLGAAWTFFLRRRRMEHVRIFESEVGDRFIGTGTDGTAATFDTPGSLELHRLPADSSADALRAAHESRLASALRDGSAPLTRMTSLDDVLAMEERYERQRDAFREAIGWVTLDELMRLTSGNRPLAEEIHREVRRIVAAERS